MTYEREANRPRFAIFAVPQVTQQLFFRGGDVDDLRLVVAAHRRRSRQQRHERGVVVERREVVVLLRGFDPLVIVAQRVAQLAQRFFMPIELTARTRD